MKIAGILINLGVCSYYFDTKSNSFKQKSNASILNHHKIRDVLNISDYLKENRISHAIDDDMSIVLNDKEVLQILY
ncbi:MAG: hypothetical protein WC667_09715 [Sulfurimonas sp.]|jgi:hypothetical protein